MGVWQHAAKGGVVGAVLDAVEDGHDRLLIAWPSRPDNSMVIAALALREARVMGRLAHATLAAWPWRGGATHAARSIQVNFEDVLSAAREAHGGVQRGADWASKSLAHDSLCLVELRLNDLMPRKARSARNDARASNASMESAATVTTGIRSNPTLLETTAVFPPLEDQRGLYAADAEQILRRVRGRTTLGTILSHLHAVGDPLRTPFALMGLPVASADDIGRHLKYPRFAQHGLDAVVVDLTRTSRASLDPDWQPQLVSLLAALEGASLPRRPPVVIICEDALTMRKAEAAVRAATSRRGEPLRLIRQGALLLSAGVLEIPTDAELPTLLPIVFEADVKDATLRPLRERLLALVRRLRDAGHGSQAQAVSSGLRALSTFASLPVGVAETQDTASILFAGDDREAIDSRSGFFSSSVLQPMADAAASAPGFEADIHAVLSEIRERIEAWKNGTPVSLKLDQLLRDPQWNSPEVLLVLPNSLTMEVFLVSNAGVSCRCTVIDATSFATRSASPWRRIIVIRPQRTALRTILTMRAAPGRVLFLADSAGAALLVAELGPLKTLPEFAHFSDRASSIANALVSGGAEEEFELADTSLRYGDSSSEALVDLTQAGDGYAGEVLRFTVAGGGQVAYRPSGDVLLFLADEARHFRRVRARDIRPGHYILLLGKQVRDRLSEAFSRSKRTVIQLRHYHEQVVKHLDALQGETLVAKARQVLAIMRAAEPSLGDNEIQNIRRWLSVEPSNDPQPPRTARDRRRFQLFTEAIGIGKTLADGFWDLAILPSRRYSAEEGYLFNKRIVQFVLDPEGIACGARFREYDGLWQSIMDSVDEVVEVSSG